MCSDCCQAAAGLISAGKDASNFWLTKAQKNVMVNEYGPDSSPHFMGGG